MKTPVDQYGKLKEILLYGDVEKFRDTLSDDFDINKKDQNGWTLLHWASAYQQNEMVSALIEKGANVDAQTDVEKETPLHIISRKGWVASSDAIVDELINAGASLNIPDAKGETALKAMVPHASLHALEKALENGAQADVKDMNGMTPLLEVSRNFQVYDCVRETALEELCKHGAKVDVKDEAGATPLMYVSYFASTERPIKMLIDHNASVNETDQQGRTVLHQLASIRYVGSDKNKVDQLVRKMKFLIEAGADVTIKDGKGKTALDYAVHSEVREVLSDAMKLSREKNATRGKGLLSALRDAPSTSASPRPSVLKKLSSFLGKGR